LGDTRPLQSARVGELAASTLARSIARGVYASERQEAGA